VKSVTVDGIAQVVTTPEEVVLMFGGLPMNAKIEITTEGGWPEEPSTIDYPVVPSLYSGSEAKTRGLPGLPGQMKKPFKVLQAMERLMATEADAEYERAFVAAAMQSFESYRIRVAMDPGPGYYRTMTRERVETILKFYENAALGMYNGFAKRMAGYRAANDTLSLRLAALFDEAQK
jgi:hypothetical protein